jgi:lysozyme family protein
MQSSYPEAIRRVLKSEGGYVNHPSDPGGPTNFGITIADYRRYAKPGATAADVRAMKVGEAQAIYRPKYWDKICGDQLPAGVDYCLFDYAVNSGTGRAPKVLQRVLRITPSGRLDGKTIAAANAADGRKLVNALCDERLRFLKSLKTWRVFGAGWERRVGEVRAAALALAAVAVAPSTVALFAAQAELSPDPTPCVGKGMVPRPTAALETAKKGGPAGAMALAVALRDWAMANPADAACAGVVAIALVIVAVALIRAWHRHAQEAAPPGAPIAV